MTEVGGILQSERPNARLRRRSTGYSRCCSTEALIPSSCASWISTQMLWQMILHSTLLTMAHGRFAAHMIAELRFYFENVDSMLLRLW